MMRSVARLNLILGATALLILAPCLRGADVDLPRTIDGLNPPAPANLGAPDSQVITLNICVPKTAGGFEASASLLFLQPNAGNLVYATVINPYPLQTPRWADQSVSPDFGPAFAVGLGYDFGCGVDVRLDWTHLNAFEHASTYSTDPPVSKAPPPSTIGSPNTQALGPSFLVIGPPPPFASALAVAHFGYDAVNLDAGLSLNIGPVQLRSFAGLQVAHISESIATRFLSSDAAFEFTDTPKSVFNGIGPRLGMEMHYLNGGFDFLGEFAGATLMGTRQSRLNFVSESFQTGNAPNPQMLTSTDTTQVIPCIDARLGASYTFAVGRFGTLKCEAGYQAAVYFDAINQYSLSGVEDTDTMTVELTQATFLRTSVEVPTNFVVHGPYLKLSFEF